MRKIETKYYCDYCEKPLGDRSHISIHIKNYAGIVSSPEWKHRKHLENRPYQFCNVDDCFAKFLSYNFTKKELREQKK